MSDKTNIEWTDATWNPITGCTIVSPGCTNCYAMKLAGSRLKHHPTRQGLTRDTKAGPVWTGEVRFNERQLLEPLGWKRPRTIFVCAHGDLFHPDVPDAWIDHVFAVMALTPHHTYQVLTKRPERMREYLSHPSRPQSIFWEAADNAVLHQLPVILMAAGIDDPGIRPKWPRIHLGQWPLPNVWLGTSVEDQRRADERIPHLLQTPAAIRFLSAEPLLGPIDLDCPDVDWSQYSEGHGIAGNKLVYDWVIVGGESGPDARPMHPDWARSLRDKCQAAGVAFFFKQWGNWTPGENVNRTRGTVRSATWWNDQWSYGSENLARDDGHIDDEPDLYELTKKASGRLLDGIEHSAMPERR